MNDLRASVATRQLYSFEYERRLRVGIVGCGDHASQEAWGGSECRRAAGGPTTSNVVTDPVQHPPRTPDRGAGDGRELLADAPLRPAHAALLAGG